MLLWKENRENDLVGTTINTDTERKSRRSRSLVAVLSVDFK